VCAVLADALPQPVTALDELCVPVVSPLSCSSNPAELEASTGTVDPLARLSEIERHIKQAQQRKGATRSAATTLLRQFSPAGVKLL
jgi:hypothetical protein